MISISNNIYGIFGSLKTDGMHYDISFFKCRVSPKVFQKTKKNKKSGGSSLLTLVSVVEQNFAKFRRLLQHLGIAK